MTSTRAVDLRASPEQLHALLLASKAYLDDPSDTNKKLALIATEKVYISEQIGKLEAGDIEVSDELKHAAISAGNAYLDEPSDVRKSWFYEVWAEITQQNVPVEDWRTSFQQIFFESYTSLRTSFSNLKYVTAISCLAGAIVGISIDTSFNNLSSITALGSVVTGGGIGILLSIAISIVALRNVEWSSILLNPSHAFRTILASSVGAYSGGIVGVYVGVGINNIHVGTVVGGILGAMLGASVGKSFYEFIKQTIASYLARTNLKTFLIHIIVGSVFFLSMLAISEIFKESTSINRGDFGLSIAGGISGLTIGLSLVGAVESETRGRVLVGVSGLAIVGGLIGTIFGIFIASPAISGVVGTTMGSIIGIIFFDFLHQRTANSQYSIKRIYPYVIIAILGSAIGGVIGQILNVNKLEIVVIVLIISIFLGMLLSRILLNEKFWNLIER